MYVILFYKNSAEEAEVERKKIGKNPAVNTSFLPDKDREAQEQQEIGDNNNNYILSTFPV